MTTSIAIQEQEAVARLSAMECPFCAGRQEVRLIRPTDEGPVACPDCDGTGRNFPGLVRPCGCQQWAPGVGKCEYCHRTGLVPVSPASALHWLMGRREFRLVEEVMIGLRYLATWGEEAQAGRGPTPLLALAAAIEASLVVKE